MFATESGRKRRVISRKVTAIAASVTMAAAAAVCGVVFAPGAEAAAGDTHFVTATHTDLYDAVDPASGPFLPVDRISRMTGPVASFPKISMVTVGNQIHLLAVVNGVVRHSIRRTDGSWSAFTDVPTDGVSIIVRVIAVNVGGALQAVLLNAGRSAYHAARSATGTWTQFIDIETQAGGLSNIDEVSAAGTIYGRLGVVVESSGRHYHTTRRSNGSWDGWENVTARTGNPGGSYFESSNMTVASVGSDVHLITVGLGGLFHAIRSPDGSWTKFRNVFEQALNPGNTGIQALAATEASGRLVLATQTRQGSAVPSELYYVMRRPDGNWESRFARFPGPPGIGPGGVQAFAVAQE